MPARLTLPEGGRLCRRGEPLGLPFPMEIEGECVVCAGVGDEVVVLAERADTVGASEVQTVVLPYSNAGWEKLSIFLNFLVSKLPAPREDDLSKGILDAIDMDSYRVEKQAAVRVLLPDQDAEIGPVPASGGGHRPEPELDRLSNILKTFNDLFGNIHWMGEDRISKLITEEIPDKVNADPAYQAAKEHSDKQNARIEHDKALERVIVGPVSDDNELFKQFVDNPDFKKWLAETVFSVTYDAPAA